MINSYEDSATAERAVIGGLLLLNSPDSELMAEAIDMLKPSSFYKQYHGKIFQAIKNLFLKNENIDLITLEAECRNIGVTEATLFVYLAEIQRETPSGYTIIARFTWIF